jgi:hypothetical protein
LRDATAAARVGAETDGRERMTWRRLTVLGIGALTLVMAMVATGGASAGPSKASKKSCPDGRMCVWTKPHYEGKRLVLGKNRGVSNRIYGYQGDPEGPFNDNVSSLKVRKKGFGVLFANVNGDGDARCFDDEHRNVPDLADPAWNFDNTASSSAIPRHDPPCFSRKAGGAAKGGSGCPDNALCVWSRRNYEGQKVKITKTGGVSNKLGKLMNNQASSLKNRIPSPGILYDKKNGEGDLIGFCDEESIANLGGKIDFNDRASSSGVASSWRSKRIC